MGLRRRSPHRIPSPRGRVLPQCSSTPRDLNRALTPDRHQLRAVTCARHGPSAFNTAKVEALLHAMPGNRDQEIRALLAFYQEAGVDALLGEKPVDRLADPPPEAASI